jgi:hypothetical protein
MNPKLTLPRKTLETRVGTAISELASATETLRGLTTALDPYCGTSLRADAQELLHAAIGIRASAVQALLTACTVVGLAERLAAFARIYEVGNAETNEP